MLRHNDYLQKILFVIFFSTSQNLFATIQGSLEFGIRSSNNETQNVQSLSALISPLPLVPLAIGGKNTQLPNSGSETALELQAWVPMVPMITPFAYVDVLIQSSLTGGKHTGHTIGFGIERSVIPFLSATVSIESGNRRFTPDDTTLSDSTAHYLALLFGVQAGF